MLRAFGFIAPPQKKNLFDLSIFQFVAYHMKIIPETRHAKLNLILSTFLLNYLALQYFDCLDSWGRLFQKLDIYVFINHFCQ